MRDMGENRAALELSRQARADAAGGGPGPSLVRRLREERGRRARPPGRDDAAADVGRDDCRPVRRASWARAHVLTVSLRAGLALDLAELGEREEAEALRRDTDARLTSLLGADHPQTAPHPERHRPYWDFEPQPI